VGEAFNNIYRLEGAPAARSLLAQSAKTKSCCPRGGDREDGPSLQAGNPRGRWELLEWPAMRRLADRIDSLVQDVMHVVERFAAWANDWRSETHCVPKFCTMPKPRVIDWQQRCFPVL